MKAPVLHALRAILLLGLSLASTRSRALRRSTVPFVCAVSVSAVLQGVMLNMTAQADDVAPLPRVLVVGDSISAAYGMSLEEGWVALLERRLQEDGSIEAIINASISGDTSGGGLRRLPALLAEHEPDILVLELGGNDGLRGYPTQNLTRNLQSMADLGRQAGAEVLILPMEIPPNYGPRYTRAFRQAFKDAAQASGAQLGPFPLEGIATRKELMQADGIHPTDDAQTLIADTLQPVVERLLATPQRGRKAS